MSTSSTDAFDRVVARERAHHHGRRRRRARWALRSHAWVFVAVNAAMIAGWLTELVTTDGGHPLWWLPTTIGWGTGLGVHALLVLRPWRRRGDRSSSAT